MCRFDVKRGNILIGVLWVIVIMTILVLALSVEARSDINRTMLHRDRARAYWLARAAVERVKYDYAANRANAAQEGGENRTRYSFEFEDGYAECLLLSNSSLMSINSNNRDMWRQLLSLYDLDDGVKDEIVDAIIDWQDPDDLVSLNGAEEEYYETLNPLTCLATVPSFLWMSYF